MLWNCESGVPDPAPSQARSGETKNHLTGGEEERHDLIKEALSLIECIEGAKLGTRKNCFKRSLHQRNSRNGVSIREWYKIMQKDS